MDQLRTLARYQRKRETELSDGRTIQVSEWGIAFESANPDRLSVSGISRTYLMKPLVMFDDEPLFGELAIVRVLQRDGWNAVWVDTFHGHGRRLLWANMPQAGPPRELDPGSSEDRLYQRIVAENGGKASGFFDVFAWRDSEFAFFEYKGKRERSNRNETSWIEASLRAGVRPEQLHIIEYPKSASRIAKATSAPFIQTVSEADIDWVVCTELNASRKFREWMGSKVFGSYEEFSHQGAWRSVANAAGESDLLWLIEDPKGGWHLAMIENKIDAPAQPEQAERYVERGVGYRGEEICDDFVTVLLAPARYRSSDSGAYCFSVQYEEMMRWFEAQGGERSKYLASLVEHALNKTASLAEPDGPISDFQNRIWQLAEKEFPELGIRRPGNVSASNYWTNMEFGKFRIIYKMYRHAGRFGECVVDLELAGRADDLPVLEEEYRSELQRHQIELVQTGKSASFRRSVPRIAPPNFCESAVRQALTEASFLLTWWQDLQGG